MDARINPCAALGIKEGDAHVIRNAGGESRILYLIPAVYTVTL